jgi:hypothetical protein
MATFDESVALGMGLHFHDVNMKDPVSYGPYRQILLSCHPDKHDISLPTYLLVQEPEADFSVGGEIVGAMPEEAFRARVRSFLVGDAPVDSEPAHQSPDD